MSDIAQIVSPGEDAIFDTLWGFIAALFDPSLSGQIVKANQNLTPTLLGTYVIIQPGIKLRQDQGVRTYALDAGSTAVGRQNVSRGTQYYYQVDCYGPAAPDWADTIAIAWRSLWACDYFASGQDQTGAALKASIAPLFADEPQQLTIVNAEQQYEQRFMTKLYLQANQTVGLIQPFFTAPIGVVLEPPADIDAGTA